MATIPSQSRRVSLLLALVYFLQNGVLCHAIEMNFWRERAQRATVGLDKSLWLGGGAPAISGESFPAKDAASSLSTRIASFGTVDETFRSSDSAAPAVVLILDIHQQLEAQKNIQNILTSLQASGDADVVGLEGAEGPFTVEPYRAFASGSVRRVVADHLLTMGRIGGAEALALSAETAPLLWGVESAAMYRANVSALLDSAAARNRTEPLRKALESDLQKEKRATYSAELLLYDRQDEAYRKMGRTGDYLRYLWSRCRSPQLFPNAGLFLEALDLEKRMDFARAEQERVRLLDAVLQRAKPDAVQSLALEARDAREGRIEAGRFYGDLRRFADSLGISLTAYPAFNTYLAYLDLCSRLNRRRFVEELAGLEEHVVNDLARTPAEKELIERNRDVRLVEKILDHEMTSDDWALYLKRKPRIDRLGISKILGPSENFCTFAVERNAALASNLLRMLREHGKKRAVLIAGGFHRDGITAELKRKNISYTVVTPRITALPDKNNPYWDAFVRDPLPLERWFSSEPLSLATERLLAQNPLGAEKDPRVRRGLRAFEGSYFLLCAALSIGIGGAGVDPQTPVAARIARGDAVSLTGFSRTLASLRFDALSPDAAEVELLPLRHAGMTEPLHFNLQLDAPGKTAPLEEVALSGGRTLRIYGKILAPLYSGFIAPLWENVALAFLGRWLEHQNYFPAMLESLFGREAVLLFVMTSIVIAFHVVVRRDARFLSLLQWGVGGLLLSSLLLSGSRENFDLALHGHQAWNLLVALAWQAGWPLASRLCPLSVIGAESPAALATPEQLQEIVSARRSLVVANTPATFDALDDYLHRYAQQHTDEGTGDAAPLRYVYLAPRNRAELNRMMTAAKTKDGWVEKQSGPLADIIRNGGMLCIDFRAYQGLVEGFNSVSDFPDPYYEEIPVSKTLRIVGIIDPAQIDGFSTPFLERFDVVSRFAMTFDDPLRKTPTAEEAEGQENVTVALNENPHFHNRLVGTYDFAPASGEIEKVLGALMEMVEGRKARVLLVLLGAGNWTASGLAGFLRTVMRNASFVYDGVAHALPAVFHVRTENVDYSEGVENKIILSPEESTAPGPVWIINSKTVDILSKRNEVTEDGRMLNLPGLLDQALADQTPLRLRVTEELPPFVWHPIMHSGATIEIQSDTGLVPAPYRKYQTDKSKKRTSPRAAKTWAEVKDASVVYVEGDDLDVMHAEVESFYRGRRIVVFPVTPDTTTDELFTPTEFIRIDGARRFRRPEKPILADLDAGDVVVFQGIQCNPKLLLELQTTLYDDPYLRVNNRRRGIPGTIVYEGLRNPSREVAAENRVVVDSTDRKLERALAEKWGPKFNADEFRGKVLAVRDRFANLPESAHPSRPGRFTLDLARLNSLYSFDGNWVEAFQKVIINDYEFDPDTAAYMRAVVRVTFGQEESWRKKNSVSQNTLLDLLNSRGPNWLPEENYWCLVDTLSVDILRELQKERQLSLDFNEHRVDSVWAQIRQALRHHGPAEFKPLFDNLSEGVPADTPVPELNGDDPASATSWKRLEEDAADLLKRFHCAFFKGPPGTGKSHLAEEMAKNLVAEMVATGITGARVFSMTMGPDLKEKHVVVSRHDDPDAWTTHYEDEKLAAFARAPGGVLIVDEANLARPFFWDKIAGFFAAEPYIYINGEKVPLSPNHHIIFTGNPETAEGRQRQAILDNHVCTLPFHPFSENFLRTRIDADLATDRTDYAPDILTLHQTFQRFGDAEEFSLRDIQDLVIRVNHFTPDERRAPNRNSVLVFAAWRVYAGRFSPAVREALRHSLTQQFGVDVVDVENKALDDLMKREGDYFLKKGLLLTRSAARWVAAVEDLLALREWGVESKGKMALLGQGPSGRGKDDFLRAVLEHPRWGYTEGHLPNDDSDAPAEGDGSKIYYRLTASLYPEKAVRTIQFAQKRGSLCVVSEANRWKSEYMEGKINDLLTGKAENPKFRVVLTENSEDFGARHAHSTALLNRMLIERLPDYPEDELDAIVTAYAEGSGIPSDEITFAVKAHVWMRNEIRAPRHHPSVRNLRRVIDRLRASRARGRTLSVEQAVRDVYGDIYLDTFLRGRKLFDGKSPAEIHDRKDFDTGHVFKRIGSAWLPPSIFPFSFEMIPSQGNKAGAEFVLSENKMRLHALGMVGDFWQSNFWHELSHGLFTRFFKGITPPKDTDPLHPFYEDWEDLRQTATFDRFFRHARLGFAEPNDPEVLLAGLIKEIIASGDTDRLFQFRDGNGALLTDRRLFQYLLKAHGRDLLHRQDIEGLAALFDESEGKAIRLALTHLERVQKYKACQPKSLAELTVKLEQLNALKILHGDNDQLLRDIVSLSNVPRTQKQKAIAAPARGETAAILKKFVEERAQPKIRGEEDIVMGKEDPGAAPPAPAEMKPQKKAAARQANRRKETVRLVQQTLQTIRNRMQTRGVTAETLNTLVRQLTDPTYAESLVPLLDELKDTSWPKIAQRLAAEIRAKLGLVAVEDEIPVAAPVRKHFVSSRVFKIALVVGLVVVVGAVAFFVFQGDTGSLLPSASTIPDAPPLRLPDFSPSPPTATAPAPAPSRGPINFVPPSLDGLTRTPSWSGSSRKTGSLGAALAYVGLAVVYGVVLLLAARFIAGLLYRLSERYPRSGLSWFFQRFEPKERESLSEKKSKTSRFVRIVTVIFFVAAIGYAFIRLPSLPLPSWGDLRDLTNLFRNPWMALVLVIAGLLGFLIMNKFPGQAVDSPGGWWWPSWLTMPGFSSDGEPVEMAHEQRVEGDEEAGAKRDAPPSAVDLAPEPPQLKQPLSEVSLEETSPELREVRHRIASDLDAALIEFVLETYEEGEEFGKEGDFTLQQLWKDAANLFLQGAPLPTLTPKPLIVVEMEQAPSQQMMAELLQFLPERGFEVVIGKPGVTKAEALATVLDPVTQVVTARELQEKIEALFARGAMERAVEVEGQNQKALKAEPVFLNFEEQLAIAKKFLADNGISEDRLALSKSGRSMGLNLRATRVVDLAPLASLTCLTVLDLAFTKVRDCSPLQHLVNLRQLNLHSATGVSDLTFLTNLKNLERLNLAYTSTVPNLDPLFNLTRLQDLYLPTTERPDLNGIQRLSSLERLGIPWEVNDLSPLRELRNLRILWFRVTPEASFGPLFGLPLLEIQVDEIDDRLWEWRMHHPNPESVKIERQDGSPFDVPTRREFLPLSFDEQITAARALIRELGLEEEEARRLSINKESFDLDLSGSDFEDTRRLARFRDLHALTISHTRVANLYPLIGLRLTNLTASHIHATDFWAIGKLSSLEFLDLSQNESLSSLEGFEGLTQLSRLDLNHCPVTDIRPILNSRKLWKLVLNFTRVKDIGRIDSLRHLTTLELTSTPVDDVSPLRGLLHLLVLHLDHTEVRTVAPLYGTNVMNLDLTGVALMDEGEIRKLFVFHPNPRGLYIQQGDSTLSLKDVGITVEEEKESFLFPLSTLEQQVNCAHGFLANHGVPDDGHLSWNVSEQTISLDLRGTDVPAEDLYRLIRLTHLDSLRHDSFQATTTNGTSAKTFVQKKFVEHFFPGDDVYVKSDGIGLEVGFVGVHPRDMTPLLAVTHLSALTGAIDHSLRDDISLGGLPLALELAYVRRCLGKLTIDSADLMTVDFSHSRFALDLRERGLENIEFLRPVTRLYDLTLSWNPLSDLSPLENCGELRHLFLDDTNVEYLNPLHAAIHLVILWVNRTHVRDLAPLRMATSLEDLNISGLAGLDITSLPFVSSVTHLMASDLGSLSDPADFPRLRNLKFLDFGHSNAATYSWLSDLAHLEYADLEGTNFQETDLPLLDLLPLMYLNLPGEHLSQKAAGAYHGAHLRREKMLVQINGETIDSIQEEKAAAKTPEEFHRDRTYIESIKSLLQSEGGTVEESFDGTLRIIVSEPFMLQSIPRRPHTSSAKITEIGVIKAMRSRFVRYLHRFEDLERLDVMGDEEALAEKLKEMHATHPNRNALVVRLNGNTIVDPQEKALERLSSATGGTVRMKYRKKDFIELEIADTQGMFLPHVTREARHLPHVRRIHLISPAFDGLGSLSWFENVGEIVIESNTGLTRQTLLNFIRHHPNGARIRFRVGGIAFRPTDLANPFHELAKKLLREAVNSDGVERELAAAFNMTLSAVVRLLHPAASGPALRRQAAPWLPPVRSQGLEEAVGGPHPRRPPWPFSPRRPSPDNFAPLERPPALDRLRGLLKVERSA